MADRIYSERETAAILEDAARRQGVAEPQARVGLTLAELEEVAADSGIERRHVAMAVAGLADPGAAPTARVMGLQAEASRTVLLERSPTDEEWGRIVAHFRRAFGAVGVTSDIGAVRAWASAASEKEVPVTASLEPEGAGARLTLSQRPGDIVGVLTMIVVGVFVVLGAATLLFDADSRWVGAVILLAGAAVYAAIRRWYARSMVRTETQFQEALGIATAVLESDAASTAGASMTSVAETVPVGKDPDTRPTS